MKNSTLLKFLFCFLSFLFLKETALANDMTCIYKDSKGGIKQVNSKDDVPYDQRKTAKCFKNKQSSYLAKPQDITLKGNLRREDINTSLGRMKIRWPRKAETFFGRTPMRAITDVAETVARALKTSAFPSHIQDIDTEWQIVFLDSNIPESQIPARLVKNCHPGWMTPPANIYIVSQRVAGLCGKQQKTKSVADADLAEVLLHEFGHAIEYQLLRRQFSGDRARAEGFATWFEMFASRYSSILSQSQIRRKTYKYARKAIQQNPSYHFSGSAGDYARASMYFEAVVKKNGVNGLMRVYKEIAKKGTPFISAIDKELHLKPKKLQKEILKLLNK